MIFNCGIVGLGRIGCGFDDNPEKKSINTHAGAYTVTKNAKLTTLCDIDESKLVKYGKKYGVTSLYTDYKEMLNRQELDCLSICTLSDSHLEIVEEAVKHNLKGIFLEKPISNSLEDASRIIRLCRENGLKLQIDHHRRFVPFYYQIKDLINSEKFGKIQHCVIYYGAGIANTGSHVFDLARLFFGDIEWIEGAYSSNSSNNLYDPNVDCKVKFKNNVMCYLFGFNLSNFGISEVDIFGSEARLSVNLYTATAQYYEKPHLNTGVLYKELVAKNLPNNGRTDGIVLGVESLFNSIEKNTEPLCTGEDGYASLEAIIASLQSAQDNGSRVTLPIKTNTFRVYSK